MVCRICGSSNLYPDPAGYYYDAVDDEGKPYLCADHHGGPAMTHNERARRIECPHEVYQKCPRCIGDAIAAAIAADRKALRKTWRGAKRLLLSNYGTSIRIDDAIKLMDKAIRARSGGGGSDHKDRAVSR